MFEPPRDQDFAEHKHSTAQDAMITTKLWTRIAQFNAFHLGSKHGLPLRLCPQTPARWKSLSAIHRGLRSTGRVSEFERDFKKRKPAEEEEGGRPTRRKRFHDPDSRFGKKSLVYRLKFGDLKDEAQSLLREGDPSLQKSRPWHEHRRPYGRRGSDRSTDAHPLGSQATTYSQRTRQSRPTSRNHYKFGHFGEDQNEEPRPPLFNSWREREARETLVRRFESNSLSRQNRRGQPRYKSPRYAEASQDERDLDNRMDRFSVTKDYSETRTTQKLTPSIHLSSAASQFLYGADVVASALREPKRKLYHLYMSPEANKRMGYIIDLAQAQNIPITFSGRDSFLLDRLSKGRPHSGVVLEASPLPQPPIASLGHVFARTRTSRQTFHFTTQWQSKEDEAINSKATSWEAHTWDDRKPLVLLLHQVLDPGNVGNLIRTARFLGVNAVGLTKYGSAEITPVVLRAAAGAADEMNIFSVSSAIDFLNESRAAGWSAYAAVPPEKHNYFDQAMVTLDKVARNDPLSQNPCILVLGNEGFGLPRGVVDACDNKVTIWRFVESRVTSLNVASAGALLIEAFMRESTNAALKSLEQVKLKDLRNTMRRDIREEELEASRGEDVAIPTVAEGQEAAAKRMW